MAYDDGARPSNGACPDAYAGNDNRARTDERLLPNDDRACERRPGCDVAMCTDVAIVVNGAPGVQNRILADARASVHCDSREQYGSSTDVNLTSDDRGRMDQRCNSVSASNRSLVHSPPRGVVSDAHHKDEVVAAGQDVERTEHRKAEHTKPHTRRIVIDEPDRSTQSRLERGVADHLSMSARAEYSELH